MKIFKQEYKLTEIVETILKSVASASPITGSLASLYNDWQAKTQYHNILDILTKLEKRISELSDKIDQTYIESDKFIVTLIQVSLKGKDELDDLRRSLYADFIAACCLIKNKDIEYYSLFDVLSRMNNRHVDVLRLVDYDMPNSVNSLSGNVFRIVSYWGENNRWMIIKNLDYLISLGLVCKIDIQGTGKLLSAIGFGKDVRNFIGGEDIYYRTALGNSLVNFLPE